MEVIIVSFAYCLTIILSYTDEAYNIWLSLSVDGTGTYAQKFVQDHDVLVKKGEDAVLSAGAIGSLKKPRFRGRSPEKG